MDIISDKLQLLEISDNELKVIQTNNTLNIQKCFISIKHFKERLKTKPGHYVIIKILNQSFICKIYPKYRVFPHDVIELNPSVRNTFNLDFKNNVSIKFCDITPVEDLTMFNEINIRVIFDSLNVMKMYDNKKELINVLKQNILKLFAFKSDFIINLDCLYNIHKMGITNVIVLDTTPNNIVGKINSRTRINVIEKLTQYQHEELTKQINPLFSLDRYRERLTDIVKLNESLTEDYFKNVFPPTKQVLLIGPSGCGKSSLVRLVAKETRSTIVHVLGHEINKSDPGETESAIREIFNTAFQFAEISGKCIINLEQVDNLCPNVKGGASHVQRAVSQLLNLLDKAQTIPGIIVMGTTNKPDNLDPSIRRHGRLETEMYIAPPTEVERENILNGFIKDHTFIDECIHKDLCKEVAVMTPGYVGADLQLLCNTIALRNHQELILHEACSQLKFWKSEFRKVISNMSPASLKDSIGTITTKYLSFDDLAGLDEIRKTLEISVIWPIKHADAFIRLGIPRPKGVLLHGPPGCAKTSLVRALVGLGTFTLISISAAELYSPYVGDAERLIRQLFERARQNSPCILFVDEIDALAGTRGEKNQVNSEVQDRIIATLLTQMDGVGHKMLAADLQNKSCHNDDGMIVIGATNRPDMVDPALLRPGRFDKHIFVPPPNYEARVEIFQCVTKNMPLEDLVDFNVLAKATESYSGADIKSICTEAAMNALTMEGRTVHEIKQEHFMKALHDSQPSLMLSSKPNLSK